MGKFLCGIFVGAIIIGICCEIITKYPIGAIYIMKNECEKSGDECVMVYDVKQERDTYRDLCAELLKAIFEVNNLNNQIEICKILEDAMSKAKTILGEKNANG